MASLTELPLEIISSICEHLTINDVRNLRIVSKDLLEKTQYSLLAKVYRVVPVMMTRASLQALLVLADDSTLRGVIKEIQIVLVKYVPERKDSLPPGSDEQRRSQRRAYCRHMHAQNLMRTTGEDVALLTQVFTKLTALESISTVARLDPHHPPLAAQDVRADIGLWPPVASVRRENSWNSIIYWQPQYRSCRHQILSFNAHVIAVVMGAIHRSRKRLRGGLSFAGCAYAFPLPKKADSRRLCPVGTPASTFNESQISELSNNFAQLKEVSFEAYPFSDQDLSIPGYGDGFGWFHDFVPLWSNVKNLSITGAGVRGEERIVSDLSKSAEIFPQLRSLSIDLMQFRGMHLIRFLERHANTLEHLRLHRSVIGGNYREMMRCLTCDAMIKFRSVDLKLWDRHYQVTNFHDITLQYPTSELMLEEDSHENFVATCQAVLQMDHILSTPTV